MALFVGGYIAGLLTLLIPWCCMVHYLSRQLD